jgi:hypothetical protein
MFAHQGTVTRVAIGPTIPEFDALKRGQSNLREGASTLASPISTFLPSTEQ